MGPNLGILYIRKLDATSFCENCAKFYFDPKYLEKGLNRRCFVSFFQQKLPFWPISDATLIF